MILRRSARVNHEYEVAGVSQGMVQKVIVASWHKGRCSDAHLRAAVHPMQQGVSVRRVEAGWFEQHAM